MEIYIGTIAGIGVLLLGVATFTYKVSKTSEEKRSNIYKRLDTVKEDFKENHVHKDVCKVLHQQLRSDVEEIKADVKQLLKMNGG